MKRGEDGGKERSGESITIVTPGDGGVKLKTEDASMKGPSLVIGGGGGGGSLAASQVVSFLALIMTGRHR